MLEKIRNDMQGYSVNGLKTMNGHDGVAWSCTIYQGSKKIVEAYDDGWGGPVSMRYTDEKAKADFMTAAAIHYPDLTFEVDGAFAAALADMAETVKKMTRSCKTKTLIQFKGEDDVYHSIDVPFTPSVAAQVRAKYGDKLACIINEQL
jgi:hypothetical protein